MTIAPRPAPFAVEIRPFARSRRLRLRTLACAEARSASRTAPAIAAAAGAAWSGCAPRGGRARAPALDALGGRVATLETHADLRVRLAALAGGRCGTPVCANVAAGSAIGSPISAMAMGGDDVVVSGTPALLSKPEVDDVPAALAKLPWVLKGEEA